MERVQGELLIEFLKNNINIDDVEIILKVLDQLILLEEDGFYHNDLRTWNIMVSNNYEKFYLIDYESISVVKEDFTDPKDIYLSFFYFFYEIVTRKYFDPDIRYRFSLSINDFPLKYRNWVNLIWKNRKENISFKYLKENLKKTLLNKKNKSEIFSSIDYEQLK